MTVDLARVPRWTLALAAGLAIGLLQALTSVQESTLTFVPKVGAMLAKTALEVALQITAQIKAAQK